MLTGDGKSLRYQVLTLTVALVVTLLLLIAAIVRAMAPAAMLPEIEMPGALPSGASSARGNPAEWITPDDYPRAAIRAGWEGTTQFQFGIDAEGRPRVCRILQSSGHPILDESACTAMMRRAEFAPARDAGGNAIASRITRRVVWKLPDDPSPAP